MLMRPESSDSEDSWTHVEESEPGHSSKPLPHDSHVVSPESDQGQGSSEGASLLLNNPTQILEAAQFRSLVESPPGTGLISRDGEASQPEEYAQGQAGASGSLTATPAGEAAPAHTNLADTSSPQQRSHGSSSQPGSPCSDQGEVPELTRAASAEAEAPSLPSVDLRGSVRSDATDEESAPPSPEPERGESLAEEGGHSRSRRWWLPKRHSGPIPSPFAGVAGAGPHMQGEEAEGKFPDSNDGQDGDGHSEGSGDTPVMVHGTNELEEFDEIEERQAREFRRASMTIEDIRRARQPINPAPRRTHTYMKIMLVGGPGLGKTTFMQMLQQQVSSVSEPYEEDEQACLLKQRAEASPGEYLDIQAKLEQHFVGNPAAFSCVLEHVDEPFSYTYTLQDMPGLLAFTDCPVAHVRDQLAAWRAVKMADEEGSDPRVDVCLYFMSPEGLRAQDVEMMTQLSKWTSVVPIIARADSLAPEGLTAYRKQVVACLEEASIEARREITWMLPEALRATVRATADHMMPPFAIISSTTFDDEFGSFWPVRHFAWGTAAAMNTEYSDLPMLRDLLFNVGLDPVKRETNAYYTKFCKCQPDEAATPITTQVARGTRTCTASRPSQGRTPIWWRRLRLKAQPLRRWAKVVGLGVLGVWAASATVAALYNGRALAVSRMELERHRTLQADQNQVITHLANTLHRVNRRYARRHRTWSCEASA